MTRPFSLLVLLVVLPLSTAYAQAFPGTVLGKDSAWLAKNDSLRRAFLARDAKGIRPSESQYSLFATAFAAALGNARTNMHGLDDPGRYCVSDGPPEHTGVVPAPLRRMIRGERAEFIDLSRCDADRALGVWVDQRQRAWLLWADSLAVRGDSAVVAVGYHAEALEAAAWLCTLRRTKGAWIATQCKLKWIS